MKQETLEEAGEKLYPNRESFLHRFQNIERKAFTEGAKWQEKRSYSEEEVLELLNQREWYLTNPESIGEFYITIKEWVEQFNKTKI
jgi:hypothetical protein